jgi:hypothetical protein
MKKVVFTPKSTVIVQMMAHQEINAVIHDNKVYVELPTPDLSSVLSKDEDDMDVSLSKAKPAPAAKPEPKSESKVNKVEAVEEEDEAYTEAELKEMDVKALAKICKEQGIEIPEEGKNTNAKLRNLILAAQDGEDDEEEEEETPKAKSKEAAPATKKSAANPLMEQALDILEKLDAADLTEAKAVAAIVKLSEDADEKAIKKIIKTFLDDDKMDIEEVAEQIVAQFEGGEEAESEEEEEAPKSKSKAAKEEPSEEVDASDLQKGDKVSVYWKSYKDWYSGEVVSTRGGVKVKYEDGTIELIDSEENPKIELLESAA